MPERKTAIITGTASGIGLEATRRFSRDPKYNPIYAADKNPIISALFPQSVYLLTYPLAGYRLDSLFFAGSTIFYQLAKWINTLRNRSDESHAIK